MDPLSALAVAAAVIQFVDVGGRIIAGTFTSYKSIDGATSQDLATDESAQTFNSICALLSKPFVASSHALTADETLLQQLVSRCQAKTDQLRQVMASFRAEGAGSKRVLSAFKRSVKRAWKASDISNLQKDLDAIHRQVNTVIIGLIKDEQSQTGALLQRIQDRLRDLGIANANTLADILEAIEKQTLLLVAHTVQLSSPLPTDDAVSGASTLQGSVASLLEKTTYLRKVAWILDSLKYPDMPDRRRRIEKAHDGTFTWMLDDSKTASRTWLESGNGVYWITGLAGSGKSTLMKFLDSSTEVQSLLHHWASRLVLASFFFCHSGSPVQRSQEGLLRSLLFQIIRQCPVMAQHLFSDVWSLRPSAQGYPEIEWSKQKLEQSFATFLETPLEGSGLKFCFFIDGLDEYDGLPSELTNLVARAVDAPHVKICISSRPWNEFKDVYGRHPDHLTVIHELTWPDMELFVREQLQSDSELWMRLQTRLVETESFIQEVVGKAQGVFLWTFLAVRSLLAGLNMKDDIHTLHQRLRLLPGELNDVFQAMLDNIEPVYRVRAALVLLTITTEKLTPVFFTHLPLLACHDPAQLTQLEAEVLNQQHTVDSILREVEYHINTCCRDLVSLSPLNGGSEGFLDWYIRTEVNFAHKLIKEFVTLPHIQLLLRSYLASLSSTGPSQLLMRVYLYELGSVSSKSGSTRPARSDALRCSLLYAKRSERRDGWSQLSSLQQLLVDGQDVLKEMHDGRYEGVRDLTAFPTSCSLDTLFTAALVEYDLRLTLEEFFSQRQQRRLIVEDSPELLETLLTSSFWSGECDDITCVLDILVNAGLDLNWREHSTYSAWQQAMVCLPHQALHCWSTRIGPGNAAADRLDVAFLLRALLQRGADPSAKIEPSKSFTELLEDVQPDSGDSGASLDYELFTALHRCVDIRGMLKCLCQGEGSEEDVDLECDEWQRQFDQRQQYGRSNCAQR